MSFSFSRPFVSRLSLSTRGASAALCLALPLLLHTRAQAQYTISAVSIDPAFGGAANVFQVNMLGQLVGLDSSDNVLLSGPHGQGATNLGMLDPFFFGSQPNAINNSGQVVGAGLLNADGSDHAFIGGPTSLTDIGTIADQQSNSNPNSVYNGGFNSNAYGINNRGQVVGDSDYLPDPTVLQPTGTHAFLYDNGVLTDISNQSGSGVGSAGLNTSAYAINDTGLIVGAGDTPVSSGGTETHAFAYQNGMFYTLGTLNDTVQSYATGVTNSGLIFGTSTFRFGDLSDTHAFLHSGLGLLTSSDDIGTFGGADSTIVSANNAGLAVGFADSATSTALPFLYQNHKLTNLNDLVAGSGWTINYALTITNDNSIYGEGIDPNGNESIFLLTPTASAVPEPGALALLVGAGITSAGLLTRKRRGALSIGR